jgi:hypothetical protein
MRMCFFISDGNPQTTQITPIRKGERIAGRHV